MVSGRMVLQNAIYPSGQLDPSGVVCAGLYLGYREKITPACEADISPLEIKPANGMLPRLPSCGVMSLPTNGYLPSGIPL